MEGDGVTLRDYVDVRCDELGRRLDESGKDRELIRDQIGARSTRAEVALLVDRIGRLETQISRLYGGLAVIGVVLGVLGLLLHYVFP